MFNRGIAYCIKDIDFDNKPAKIHVRGENTKTKTDRTIFLTEEVTNQLNVLLKYKYRTRLFNIFLLFLLNSMAFILIVFINISKIYIENVYVLLFLKIKLLFLVCIAITNIFMMVSFLFNDNLIYTN